MIFWRAGWRSERESPLGRCVQYYMFRLGISRALAYEAAHRGELPMCRIGRRMLVPRVALLRLLGQDGPSGSQSA